MRIKLLFIFASIYSLNVICQVTPDSLLGTYIGEFYWRHNQDPWTIRPDTIYVTGIDTVPCLIKYINWSNDSTMDYLHTKYTFCEGDVSNWYTLFHPTDSVSIVYDDYGPPPGDDLYSHRFYGKKIKIITGNAENATSDHAINIYPNPAKTTLTIDGLHNEKVEIYSLQGQLIKRIKEQNTSMRIDISGLSDGIYIVRLQADTGITIRKFVKAR